jgi:hypothetical protein
VRRRGEVSRLLFSKSGTYLSSPALSAFQFLGSEFVSHLVLLSLVTYDLFVRRILPFVCIFFAVALVSVYQRDRHVPLFPRQLSQNDITIARTFLAEGGVPHAYDSPSGRLLVTQESRAKHLPALVYVGVPTEPGFVSELEDGDEFEDLLSAMLKTSMVKFQKTKSGQELSIESSWQVAPADISAVYRLLALYYPHLDLDEIRMKLDVGTDLSPESLVHYGLAGYNESNVRQGRVQEVLDKLSPRKAIGLVTVGYLPPSPVHEDDIEDGDFSRYMMRKSVRVEIYLDRGRFTESELEQLKQQVSRALGMLFEEDGSITIREFVERGVGPRG